MLEQMKMSKEINYKDNTIFLSNTALEQSRDTGLALVLGILFFVYFSERLRLIPLAIIVLFLSMLYPNIFRPLSKLWFGLSYLMGSVMAKVIMAILFFILVTPIGVLRRIIGYDPMQLKKWKKGNSSVFIIREKIIQSEDLGNPY